GYQGGYQDGAPNGFYEDQYQEDQYQDAGYEEGPVTGQYDVPRQQYADDRDGYDEYDEDPAPWAGQSIYPAGPGRVERRPPPVRQAVRGGRPGYQQDWPEDDDGEQGPPRRGPGQEVQAQAPRRGRRGRRRGRGDAGRARQAAVPAQAHQARGQRAGDDIPARRIPFCPERLHRGQRGHHQPVPARQGRARSPVAGQHA